jgi:hypothetical protein
MNVEPEKRGHVVSNEIKLVSEPKSELLSDSKTEKTEPVNLVKEARKRALNMN